MGRYDISKMGDYFHNRLFCVHKEILIQPVSVGCNHGISMSGMWDDEGGFLSAASGFCGSISDASIHLCDWRICGDIRMEPLYSPEKSRKVLEYNADCNNDCDDIILFVEDEDVFSGGSAYELLSGESAR